MYMFESCLCQFLLREWGMFATAIWCCWFSRRSVAAGRRRPICSISRLHPIRGSAVQAITLLLSNWWRLRLHVFDIMTPGPAIAAAPPSRQSPMRRGWGSATVPGYRKPFTLCGQRLTELLLSAFDFEIQSGNILVHRSR